jgi:hypothetical protein
MIDGTSKYTVSAKTAMTMPNRTPTFFILQQTPFFFYPHSRELAADLHKIDGKFIKYIMPEGYANLGKTFFVPNLILIASSY